MQAIDDYIPDPTRALDRPFSLPVEDVFSIQGRGTVVTGRIEQGVVKVGEEIEIIGIQPPTKTTVTGLCMCQIKCTADYCVSRFACSLAFEWLGSVNLPGSAQSLKSAGCSV